MTGRIICYSHFGANRSGPGTYSEGYSTTHCIIYLIILLKVATFPWYDVNMNMRHSLSCLRPILKHQQASSGQCSNTQSMLWLPSGYDNKQENSSYFLTPKKKERYNMSLLGTFLLGWQMWVTLHCEISQADCQPSLPWTTNHWSHRQLDLQSASLHALGKQAHVPKVKPTKLNTQQVVLCIINWIKLYIIKKFDQHSKGTLPFMKWLAHEILSSV